MRIIDADTLCTAFEPLSLYAGKTALKIINEAKTIYPLGRGVWAWDDQRRDYVCTDCGGASPLSVETGDEGVAVAVTWLSHYCPHCGAKMEGVAGGPKWKE